MNIYRPENPFSKTPEEREGCFDTDGEIGAMPSARATAASQSSPQAVSSRAGIPIAVALLPLASAIVEGNLTLLPRTEHPLFEVADWQTAAADALEGDPVDLAWMLAREQAFDEFSRWQAGDYAAREFADFSNWIVSKASWNRPNRFEAALTAHERRLAA